MNPAGLRFMTLVPTDTPAPPCSGTVIDMFLKNQSDCQVPTDIIMTWFNTEELTWIISVSWIEQVSFDIQWPPMAAVCLQASAGVREIFSALSNSEARYFDEAPGHRTRRRDWGHWVTYDDLRWWDAGSRSPRSTMVVEFRLCLYIMCIFVYIYMYYVITNKED